MLKKICILIFIIEYLIINITCDGEVPVIIWGTGINLIKYKPSALNKLSAGEFYDYYLKNLISYSPPTLAVFVEESLSSEDFRWRDTSNENAYPTLQHIAKDENIKFIPYVNNPLKAIKRLREDDYKLKTYEKGNEKEDIQLIKSGNLYNESNNVIVINLFDATSDEDRPDLLRRHDKYISAICRQMQEKYGNVICILTANQPSWIEPETIPSMRKLLAVNGNDPVVNLYRVNSFGMIYTKAAPILGTSGSLEKLIFNENVNPTVQKFVEKVTFKTSNMIPIKIDFNFVDSGNSWKLPSITLTIDNIVAELTTNSNIGTSRGFSFHTPVPVVFKNNDYNVTFRNFQIELFFGVDRSSFSVADDTVPFFTIPILSGLLVSGLLFTIVLIGLSMIFDIKTMDQFDDPKGKTITIAVSE